MREGWLDVDIGDEIMLILWQDELPCSMTFLGVWWLELLRASAWKERERGGIEIR